MNGRHSLFDIKKRYNSHHAHRMMLIWSISTRDCQIKRKCGPHRKYGEMGAALERAVGAGEALRDAEGGSGAFKRKRFWQIWWWARRTCTRQHQMTLRGRSSRSWRRSRQTKRWNSYKGRPLLFEIALVHATFAAKLAERRHEFRCSWFRNGWRRRQIVSALIWQIWGPCSNKLMSSVPSCLRLANTWCLLAQWIPSHTTVDMSRLLSAAAVAWSLSTWCRSLCARTRRTNVPWSRLVALFRAKRANSTYVLVPSCKRRQTKRSSPSYPTTKPSSAAVSVVVGLNGISRQNPGLGFFRKLWLTVLQRFCSRYVMAPHNLSMTPGDVIREYTRPCMKDNFLSSWLREGLWRWTRKLKKRWTKRRKEKRRMERTKWWLLKEGGTNPVSAEAVNIFQPGGGFGELWELLGETFWVNPCGSSDCDSVTWTGVPVVSDVLVFPLLPRWLWCLKVCRRIPD